MDILLGKQLEFLCHNGIILMQIHIASLTKLHEEEIYLKIPSKSRFKPSAEIVKQAVIDEVEKDLGRRNGPDFIKDKLRLEHGLHVGRQV
jgi:hypothetical protein